MPVAYDQKSLIPSIEEIISQVLYAPKTITGVRECRISLWNTSLRLPNEGRNVLLESYLVHHDCCFDDSGYRLHTFIQDTWARFLSLTWSKLRLWSANHRAGYFSNLACDWRSIVWAYCEQETGNGPRTVIQCPGECIKMNWTLGMC